jgi:hypothetical protein
VRTRGEEPIRVWVPMRNTGAETIAAGTVMALDNSALAYSNGEDKAILFGRGFRVAAKANVLPQHYEMFELLFDAEA